MDVFLLINENKKVIHYGLTRSTDAEIQVDVEDGHDFFKNPMIYSYKNNKLTKDTKRQKSLVAKKQLKQEMKNSEEWIAALYLQAAMKDIKLSYQDINQFYSTNLYSAQEIKTFVQAGWITARQYKQITGETYKGEIAHETK